MSIVRLFARSKLVARGRMSKVLSGTDGELVVVSTASVEYVSSCRR